MHCDSGGGREAHFGGGTKLTVLGKKLIKISLFVCYCEKRAAHKSGLSSAQRFLLFRLNSVSERSLFRPRHKTDCSW